MSWWSWAGLDCGFGAGGVASRMGLEPGLPIGQKNRSGWGYVNEGAWFVLISLPVQPLMDNLESQTYEVFEKDPIKYSQYQQVGGTSGWGGGTSGVGAWPRPLT